MSRTRLTKWLLPIGIAATPLILWNDLLDPAMSVRILYLTLFGAGITAYLWLDAEDKFLKAVSEIIHWRNPFFIAMVIWLLATLLSLSVVIQKSEGYLETARVIFFALSFVWVAAWVKVDRENILWLSIGFCITGFLLCCFGIKDFYESFSNLTADEIYYPMSGRMGNRNLLAIMISLCLPFHVIVFSKDKSLPVRIVLSLNFLFGVSVVALTSSRVGWLGLAAMAVIGVLVFTIHALSDFKSRTAIKLFAAAAAFTIAIAIPLSVLFLKNPSFAENLKQRVKSFYNFNTEKNDHAESIQERLDLWKKSVQLIIEHPVTGVGAGNWKFVYPEKGLRGRSETGRFTFMQPHNDFIWVFSETGILGGLAFTSLFAIGLLVLTLSFRRGQGEVYLALFTGIILYAIHSFFDFPKERPFILFTFATLLGMVTAFGGNQKAKSFSTKSFRSISLILIATALLTVGFWTVRMRSELHLKKSLAARQSGNFKEMKKELEKINSTFFESDLLGTPVDWYRAEAAYSTGNQKDFKRYSESALKLNPYQLYNLYNLGSIYYREGDLKTAIFYWEKAVSIAPGFTDAAVNLSAAYYNTGEFERAALLLYYPEIDYSNKMYSTIVTTVLGKYIFMMSEKILDSKTKDALRRLSVDADKLKKMQTGMSANHLPLDKAVMEEASAIIQTGN